MSNHQREQTDPAYGTRAPSGATTGPRHAPPGSTPVLVAGGGPVGLAAAVELGRRGIGCVVVEPRATVSRVRPRCKTVNVATMEHLRRWGIAEQMRDRAPIPVSWSSDVVFCTSLAGRELSRFTGAFGLLPGDDRFAEPGQQAPQYVLEELLRDTVAGLDACTLLTGWSVVDLNARDDEVLVRIADADGRAAEVRAGYVLGCDGSRSTVRDRVGARYVGERALTPNLGMVFRAPQLARSVAHGPAVQYWTVKADAPALMGPLDLDGTWWIIATGVDRDGAHDRGPAIVEAAAGVPVDATILGTDPWTARMQLVDRARVGRVFLAGDAAHLNPPFGGHGLNTGIADAVDLGWKLAAVLHGWGGPGLLDSYERERRPVQDKVIRAAEQNMRTLAGDLVTADLDRDDTAGDRARHLAHERIQQTKHVEFHALDLVLGVEHRDSPVVADGLLPRGCRLAHRWLADGRSLYDLLGPDLTLLVRPGHDGGTASAFAAAARDRAVPLTVAEPPPDVDVGADLVLVRPDRHVAWSGTLPPSNPGDVLDLVCGQLAGHLVPTAGRRW